MQLIVNYDVMCDPKEVKLVEVRISGTDFRLSSEPLSSIENVIYKKVPLIVTSPIP